MKQNKNLLFKDGHFPTQIESKVPDCWQWFASIGWSAALFQLPHLANTPTKPKINYAKMEE